MRTIIRAASARRDLMDIAAFHGDLDPGLPARLPTIVARASAPLRDHPGIGARTQRRGARTWRIGAAPFLLFQSVSEERIEIKRVRHAAENWREP